MSSRREAIEQLQGAFDHVESLMLHFSEFAMQTTRLTGPQLVALRAVGMGATKVGDVAQATMTHVSTASRVIDQLVDAGLVDRHEDPSDRRAVVLSRTEEGEARFQQMRDAGARLLDEALGAWDVHAVERFADAMRGFGDGMSAAFAARAAQE